MPMNRLSSIACAGHRSKRVNAFSAFQTLVALKAPWGQYSADSWNSVTNTLTDITGHGHHAITSGLIGGKTTKNGADGVISALSGITTSTILWPAGSIPAAYTICSITRYSNSATNQQRILSATIGAWLHGFYITMRGVAFNGAVWQTASSNTGTRMNWLNLCVSSSATAPTNVLVDGVSLGLSVGGGACAAPLCINLGDGHENSDFGFSQLIIWDQVLSATELATVSAALATYLATGVLI